MTEGSTCLKYFPWFKEVLPKALISAIHLKLYTHLLISSMSNRSLGYTSSIFFTLSCKKLISEKIWLTFKVYTYRGIC